MVNSSKEVKLLALLCVCQSEGSSASVGSASAVCLGLEDIHVEIKDHIVKVQRNKTWVNPDRGL